MTNAFNKNSQYIQSLTDFILDTKPYHSKLTEVIEEYQFFDSMTVTITENSSSRIEVDPVTSFNFFSGGAAAPKTFSISQPFHAFGNNFSLNTPPLTGRHKAFRDEISDLVSVPFVFSKLAFDEAVADVLVERNGNRLLLEPMLEGHDFFTSLGAFQALIKQTSDANTNFVPSWTTVENENAISTASAVARLVGNNLSISTSAAAQILSLLQLIQLQISTAGPGANAVETAARADAAAEVASLISQIQAIVPNTSIQLPTDYELLLNSLTIGNVTPLVGYAGWVGNDIPGFRYVSKELSRLSSGLYFNLYSDHSTRESGLVEFIDVETPLLNITNITTSNSTVPGDTWFILPTSSLIPTFQVISNLFGFVGTFTAGNSFSSSTVSFDSAFVSQPTSSDVANFRILIKSKNRFIFGPTANLEAWTIIKTHPLAYTRPAFNSTRYGYLSGLQLLDTELPTGDIILTALNSEFFELSSTVEPTYTATIQVGVPFNDGRLSFTIVEGSAIPFVSGDRFYIPIQNAEAEVRNLDLGYGYDLDSFDNQNLQYDVPNPAVNFAYASRFTDYDFDAFGLAIQQNAISGRSWRLVAIPNLSLPIATIKKDGSGPSASIDLQDSTSGVSPDVSSTAAPLYSMLGDANPAPDLVLYYANEFRLEYSDDNFNTTTVLAVIPVGTSFADVAEGISFTLAPGSKPFVAVVSDDGLANPMVEGGDVFSFYVVNDDPIILEAPTLISNNVPRLAMFGSGFYEAPAANWTITFTSSTAYNISGIYSAGPQVGTFVYPAPVQGTLPLNDVLSNEGSSYSDDYIHFRIERGAGFAAGDTFTFTTFDRKPSYLVHGSVTGWTAPATVGIPYWNGHIGFLIEQPRLRLLNQALAVPEVPASSSNTWNFAGVSISVPRVRFDAESTILSLEPHYTLPSTLVGWSVYKAGEGYLGLLPLVGQLKTKLFTLVSNSTVAPALKIEVIGDDFELVSAQNAVILNPITSAKLPTSADFVLIDKRRTDTVSINLNYAAVQPSAVQSLIELKPSSIDPLFIDTSTGSINYPITAYSPEVNLLRDWIPLTAIPYDSETSIAKFSDSAVSWIVKTAINGKTIGTISTSNGKVDAVFTWDDDFFAKYLPLNAEANLMIMRSGFNDLVRVKMVENLNVLISGGALSTDFLFNDTVSVAIAEENTLSISQDLNLDVDVAISDGPFIGFLPGYDNLSFDDESDGYDTGIPITNLYHDAVRLSGPSSGWTAAELALTPAQVQTRLANILSLIQPFLVNADLNSTSYEDFEANLLLAYPSGIPTASGFGVPLVGSSIDITIGAEPVLNPSAASTNDAETAIEEAMAIRFEDLSYAYDNYGYGDGPLDEPDESTVQIQVPGFAPIPAVITAPSYDEFETPLKVVGDEGTSTDFQSRVFLFCFVGSPAVLAAMTTPVVGMWRPGEAAPTVIPVVEKVKDGLYRIVVPQKTEAKFYLQ